jgi:iron complex transport system ATP-binding protein
MSHMYELDHVSYTYPASHAHALNQVSMDITEHRATAILGPNGAGKSTLLDLLLGWKAPDTGTILLKGAPIHSYSRRDRGKIVSLVPQNEPLQFSFTLLDYVLFGRAPYLPQLAKPSSEDIDIALWAIERVQLDLSPQRSVTSLSGGQRQLLMLARAIAQQPEMIILDEPTSSLDPGNISIVIDIMHRLLESGMTLLYTTHDPNFAAETAHHTAMLKQGKLLRNLPTGQALTGAFISELYDTSIEVLHHEDRDIVFRSTVNRQIYR